MRFLIGNLHPPTGGAGAATTLDPAHKAGSIGLSGGNLTATGANFGSFNWQYVRATQSKVAGKVYLEQTVGAVSQGSFLGACNPATAMGPVGVSVASTIGGADPNSFNFFNADGSINQGGVTLALLGAYTAVGFAIDFAAGKFWGRRLLPTVGNWNGSGAADPATGVGGLTLPAGISGGNPLFPVSGVAGLDTVTINFGAGAFVGAIPAGFVAWG